MNCSNSTIGMSSPSASSPGFVSWAETPGRLAEALCDCELPGESNERITAISCCCQQGRHQTRRTHPTHSAVVQCCCWLNSACNMLSVVATKHGLLAVQLPTRLMHFIPDIGMPDGGLVRNLLWKSPQIEQVSGLGASGTAYHCEIYLQERLSVAVPFKLQCCPRTRQTGP